MNLRDELRFLPYRGPAQLQPTLRDLVRERDIRRVAAGIPTPGGSEASRIQLLVASELKRAGGGGGKGGGGEGGSGGGVHSHCVQPINNADSGSGTCQGCKGTPLTNPTRIPVLTLRAGENTWYVLRNVALPNLEGSIWCKHWHRGGRCFSACDRKGRHIPPTAVALSTVTSALKVECAPG